MMRVEAATCDSGGMTGWSDVPRRIAERREALGYTRDAGSRGLLTT